MSIAKSFLETGNELYAKENLLDPSGAVPWNSFQLRGVCFVCRAGTGRAQLLRASACAQSCGCVAGEGEAVPALES